jgi:sugar phosphate isomerase/epimerase
MDLSRLVFSGNDDVYAGDITKLIRVSTQFGIDLLELWFPKTAPFESIDEVETLLLRSQKKVACVTTWSHLYSESYETEREVLLKGLEIAGRLGAPRVNTYFGHYIYNNPRRAVETYVKNIAPVIEAAGKKGITICLENEFDSRGQDPGYSDITRSADLMLQLMELVDSPLFKVTFDPANCYVAGEEAYPYFYSVVKNYIDYIHLKDVRKYVVPKDRGRRIWSDHERNYIFTPLGEGVMNYLGIFKALHADGYQGLFAIEPHIEKEELLLEAYEKNLAYIANCHEQLTQKGNS